MNREHFLRTELTYALAEPAATVAISKFPDIASMVGGTVIGPNVVETLYFDDPERTLYRQARDRLDEQLQVRIRSYVDMPKASKFMEVKYKRGVETEKVRTIALVDSWENVDALRITPRSDTDMEVLSRFLGVVEQYRLRPTMLMSYRRTAVESQNGQSFRLTADQNISARSLIDSMDEGGLAISIDYVVFEIKSAVPLSEPLSRKIGKLQLGKSQTLSKFFACTDELLKFHKSDQ